MSLQPLHADWSVQRDLLQRIATHVLAQARFRHDGLFDLMPLAGGFGTPMVGPQRERVRLVGASLFVERVVGDDVGDLATSTEVIAVAGNSVSQLCGAIGFEPDPRSGSVATHPPFGDPNEPLRLDGAAANALGEWYLLGQRAIDAAIASVPGSDASVGRLWPEHFDYGIDLDAAPGVRTNLGAAAGDAINDEPYLYVGPWESPEPGSNPFWNAPFGAVLTYGDVATAADPLARAIEFFLHRAPLRT